MVRVHEGGKVRKKCLVTKKEPSPKKLMNRTGFPAGTPLTSQPASLLGWRAGDRGSREVPPTWSGQPGLARGSLRLQDMVSKA